MNATLQVLYGLRLFTLDEAVEALKTGRASMGKTIQRYSRMGLLRHVRRNLHCMNDIVSGNPLADKYEIASHVSESSYVAYHTALEFHGLAHQTFYACYVMSKSRFKNFEFDGCDYQWCSDTIGGVGVSTPIGNEKVRVTDIERTIVDCIDRIDRAGGIEELLHCIESVILLNEEKLTKYLELYGKAFLYQKTGYLLERIKEQAHLSEAFIEMCRQKGHNAVKLLTNDQDSDTYIKRWNLYVPYSITSKQENYELI